MVDYIVVTIADATHTYDLRNQTTNTQAVVAFDITRAVNVPSHILKIRCATKYLEAAQSAAGWSFPAVKQNLAISYYTSGVGTVQFNGFITNIAYDSPFTVIEAMGNGLHLSTIAVTNEVTTVKTSHALAKEIIELVDVDTTNYLMCTDYATSTVTVGDTMAVGKRKYKADVQVAADLVKNLSLISAGHTAQPLWVYVQKPSDKAYVNIVNRGKGVDNTSTITASIAQSSGIIGKVTVTSSVDDVFNDITVKSATGEYNTTTSTPSLTVSSRQMYGKRSKLLSVQEFYDNGQVDTAYGSGQQLAESVLSFAMTPTTVVKFKAKHDALISNGVYVINQTYNVSDEITGTSYSGMVCTKMVHRYPSLVDEVEMVSQGFGSVAFTDSDSEFTYRVEQLEQYTANRNVMCLAQADGTQYFATADPEVDGMPAYIASLFTVVKFAEEDYDYGQCFNGATGVFTAPVSGIYHFEVYVEIAEVVGVTISGVYRPCEPLFALVRVAAGSDPLNRSNWLPINNSVSNILVAADATTKMAKHTLVVDAKLSKGEMVVAPVSLARADGVYIP